jgi:beta-galactosidase
LRERGIIRGHLSVDAETLASPAVELWFGKIENGIAVFINGAKIGTTGDSRYASVYDVKALLHPGENTIAVTLANYGGVSGVNLGVALRLQEKPSAIAWSRSVFNGLAQIIVKSSKQPGSLKLTASAEGLKAATLSIQAQPVTARPVLP